MQLERQFDMGLGVGSGAQTWNDGFMIRAEVTLFVVWCGVDHEKQVRK